MEFLKKIETNKGQVILVNSDTMGIYKKDFNSKSSFQSRVVHEIVNKVYKGSSLMHYENGAPYLLDNPINISISHSRNLFAIYLSLKEAVGVDVETFGKDLIKGRSYFLNKDEIQNEWTNEELYIIWSVKESFFKMKHGDIVDLKNEVTVKKIKNDKVVLFFRNNLFDCNYSINPKYTLSFI
jgi:hypothetical protein